MTEKRPAPTSHGPRNSDSTDLGPGWWIVGIAIALAILASGLMVADFVIRMMAR